MPRKPVLTHKQAAAIRRAYGTVGVGPSLGELARRYGVSNYVIYKIVHRQGTYGTQGSRSAKAQPSTDSQIG